jgi:hypothetical protein
VVFPEFDSHNNYVVNQSKKGIYRQIVRLADAIGKEGLETLRDILLELVDLPVGNQFSDHHRRYFAEELFHNGVLSKIQAVELGLSSTLDANDDDPMQRQEVCFEIATFLHSIGEDTLSVQWLKKAGEVSAGAGSHKDYHMYGLSKWLSKSIRNDLNADKLIILEKFARAVTVAGGAGSSDAAANELQSVLQLDPNRTFRFAVELIDRDVLNVSQTLEALILGGVKAGASAELLIAMYCELLSLISIGETSDVAVAILYHFPKEKRNATANTIMNHVRTNSLPSNRIEIARVIQDALRQDGFGESVLTQGLKPGRNDSSMKSSLYRGLLGETETIDQVAARLSNLGSIEEWNPNPTDNVGFNWWSAVMKAKIRDISHLNDLISAFPPSDYREVDIIDLKSERLLEIGDRAAAIRLAEEAIDRAKDGSWYRWMDGAQKIIAYKALKRIDVNKSISLARAQFGKDLSTGKLYSYYLLSDILEIFEFLEIEWPNEAVCRIMDDYLNHVLTANHEVPQYGSMIRTFKKCSVDEALCKFLIHLLAFPVVDVGIAARKALSQYALTNGNEFLSLVKAESCWDSVQLEHILVCLHNCSLSKNVALKSLQDWIQNLNKNESIAVRAIARRICVDQEWQWQEINNYVKQPVILLSESLANPNNYNEACMLVGRDIETAYILFNNIFTRLEESGLDALELKSEFIRFFREIAECYSWVDDYRLKKWMTQVNARIWLNPRVIIGREAAMRVLGKRSLSGQAPSGAEQSYDYLYPIYDPNLELKNAVERPLELRAMDWGLGDDRAKAWLKGENADSWVYYPEFVDGLHIIGERTLLIRPDWEWPREERYRGLVISPRESNLSRECLFSNLELTLKTYLRKDGQTGDQFIILNSEHQLIGPAYRWAAINCAFARYLGWLQSNDEPFKWVDTSGDLMVKSIYWRDGWIGLEPPHFESLCEGWLVLATEKGFDIIRQNFKNLEQHLWVERYSHGVKSYKGLWHLSKKI